MSYKLSLLLLLLMCISTTGYSQKIKVKKDQVFVDNELLYSIVDGEADSKLIPFKIVTEPGKKILFDVDVAHISVPKYPHDILSIEKWYTKLKITDYDSVYYFSNYGGVKKNLIKVLYNIDALDNSQQIKFENLELLEKYMTLSNSEYAGYQQLSKDKQEILKDPIRMEHMQGLVKRKAVGVIVFKNKKIYIESKLHNYGSDPVTDPIAGFTIKNASAGDTYYIYSENAPGTTLATIFMQEDEKRIFIRTMCDNRGEEILTRKPIKSWLNIGVQYLLREGYL